MPAGPIGPPVDLRKFLPDSLRASTAPGSDTTFHQQMRVGPDSAPVELTWTAYQHGSGHYLATISGRLLADAQYDSLALQDVSDLENRGSKSVVDEAARIRVAWWKKSGVGTTTGMKSFWFTASGKSLVGVSDTR